MIFGLLGRKDSFLPHERAVLAAVAAAMDVDLRSRFEAQLVPINKIQRFGDGKEVNLYATRFGKPSFADALRLPTGSAEELFARASIQVTGSKKPLDCEVWLASGRIFSLVFSASPKKLLDDQDRAIEKIDVVVRYRGGKIDPEREYRPTELGQMAPSLVRLLREGVPAQLYARPARGAHAADASFPGALPDDYLDLVRFHDGVRWNDCRIYGVDEIRTVVTDEANYHVLAQIGTEVLVGIRSNGTQPQVYILEHDSKPVHTGTSLLVGLARAMSKSP